MAVSSLFPGGPDSSTQPHTSFELGRGYPIGAEIPMVPSRASEYPHADVTGNTPASAPQKAAAVSHVRTPAPQADNHNDTRPGTPQDPTGTAKNRPPRKSHASLPPKPSPPDKLPGLFLPGPFTNQQRKWKTKYQKM